MRRAIATLACALLASACTAPELGRAWPADHPLRAEATPEAPAAELPSLAPVHQLPAAQAAGGGHGHGAHHAHAYACPMHPEVTSDAPGTCPRCGMDLVATRSGRLGPAEVRP